jgi:hypothetical protein
LKYSQAPAGHYTRLNVIVRLGNGTEFGYSWRTRQALMITTHKAARWAREAMTAHKVPGRSSIVGLVIDARYVKGRY